MGVLLLSTMSTLEEISDDIRRELTSFEKTVEGMKKKTIEERRASMPAFKSRVGKIKNLLETFTFQIETEEATNKDIPKYQKDLKDFRAVLKKIEQQIDYLKSEGVRQEDLFAGAKSANGIGTNQALVIDPNTKDRKQLIMLGKQTQQQGLDALDRAARDIQQMDQIGNDVQLELNKQIEQLDRIYDTVKDTQTTMKRAQKYVRYFARQVYTDKCLMAMIILIVLAIIAIVIMSIVGVNKGTFNQPDQIKTS